MLVGMTFVLWVFYSCPCTYTCPNSWMQGQHGIFITFSGAPPRQHLLSPVIWSSNPSQLYSLTLRMVQVLLILVRSHQLLICYLYVNFTLIQGCSQTQKSSMLEVVNDNLFWHYLLLCFKSVFEKNNLFLFIYFKLIFWCY